ncbi:hypothetical protein [uncultured Porticoccus sp.]|uniref:hypothetical protein n=1 Tax=uncultured Porticoccus sp. TaxID=1256050 RepID=UPI002633732F|nr:hypothetical protein [uncultured Porticoccus sp.]
MTGRLIATLLNQSSAVIVFVTVALTRLGSWWDRLMRGVSLLWQLSLLWIPRLAGKSPVNAERTELLAPVRAQV